MGGDDTRGVEIPDLERTVAGRGDHAPAVGRHRARAHPIRVAVKGGEEAAGIEVPWNGRDVRFYRPNSGQTWVLRQVRCQTRIGPDTRMPRSVAVPRIAIALLYMYVLRLMTRRGPTGRPSWIAWPIEISAEDGPM